MNARQNSDLELWDYCIRLDLFGSVRRVKDTVFGGGGVTGVNMSARFARVMRIILYLFVPITQLV
jgi:hypothetical protein